MLVAPPADGAGEAVVASTVVLTECGCLGLAMGADVLLVVWPSGSAPLPDGPGVDVPDFDSFQVGDEVHTGGGYGDRERLEGMAGIPRDCLTAEVAYPSGS